MPTQERGEATRSQILKAAIAAFAHDGYDGTGIAEICKRAGISKGAFYHHFTGKQALYLELLNEWLTSIDTQLQEVRGRSASSLEALIEMTRIFRGVFEKTSTEIGVFLEFLTKAARENDLREAALAPYRRYQRYFTQIIEQGVAEGTISVEDPERAAQILVSMAVGLVLQGVIDPDGTDRGAIAEEATTLFIRGFMARR